jgi:hypothetical protein
MIIYKTLSSNISATTQYNDFVWGDEWGNIWGVGYSTEMSTIMTRVKPISSQTLVNTVSINGKRLIKALLNSIETFCNLSFKEVTRITIITSATVNSLIRRNLFKTITMNTNTQSVKTAKSRIILKAVNIINSFKQLNVKKYINTGLNTHTVKTIKANKIFIHTLNLISSFTKNTILTYIKELSSVLIVNISTKKHIKKLIAVIVDMLNLKNVKTFKSIEAIITAYETINKKINSTIKGITTTLALTSKGIKKSINVISNILSVEIYNLRFIKILSTAISVVTSILAKFKQVVIDVIFKLGIPKNIIFNLTENQDIAFTLTQDNDVTIQADDITDIVQ